MPADELPCSSCTALCCGPVPLSRKRMSAINEYLGNLSPERIQKLRQQRRGSLTCKFVDMSNHSCAIYSLRPDVCRYFGRTEKLTCPQIGRVVDPVLPILVSLAVNRDTEDVAMYSTEFEYGS